MSAKHPQDEVAALARAVRAHVEHDARSAIDGYPERAPLDVRPPSAAPAPGPVASDDSASDLFLTPALRNADSLPALCAEIGDCQRCKLAPQRTNLVFGVGNPKARLVFVGEAPGADEDAKGEPFVGRAGQLLTEIITKGMGLRREDVYIANVIKCRPPGNRNPEPDEVASCEPFLIRQLELIRPQVIVALGKFAVQTLLRTKTPISKLRGQWGDYQGIKVMPTFHPAYLLRNPGDKRLVWSDIKAVLAELGLPVPPR